MDVARCVGLGPRRSSAQAGRARRSDGDLTLEGGEIKYAGDGQAYHDYYTMPQVLKVLGFDTRCASRLVAASTCIYTCCLAARHASTNNGHPFHPCDYPPPQKNTRYLVYAIVIACSFQPTWVVTCVGFMRFPYLTKLAYRKKPYRYQPLRSFRGNKCRKKLADYSIRHAKKSGPPG